MVLQGGPKVAKSTSVPVIPANRKPKEPCKLEIKGLGFEGLYTNTQKSQTSLATVIAALLDLVFVVLTRLREVRI